MKSVLISIKPKWCELIASGKKTIEVRKTRPKCDAPFKCYIYCTKEFYRKGDGYFQGKYCGKVIGEFVCSKITDLRDMGGSEFFSKSCMTYEDWQNYTNYTNHIILAWHISNLVIYDKPKELSDFKKINRDCWYANLGLAKRDCPECKNADCFFARPPQSWCYTEGVEE